MEPATSRPSIAGPPGHLKASAGLRQPPEQQAVSDARVLATRIRRPALDQQRRDRSHGPLLIRRLDSTPARARCDACTRPGPACAYLIKHCTPWPVWGKEGQSGWEGQSKRSTGWTRGGVG
jgi:hypothetical protein